MALPARDQLKYWGIAAVVFSVTLWFLGDVLLPFVLGGAIAYFLDPVADRLEKMGFSRVMATAINKGLNFHMDNVLASWRGGFDRQQMIRQPGGVVFGEQVRPGRHGRAGNAVQDDTGDGVEVVTRQGFRQQGRP